MQVTYGYTGRQLINAYNRGPTGVKSVAANYAYAVSAEAKFKEYKMASNHQRLVASR